MKYVKVKDKNGRGELFLFPDTMSHAAMEIALGRPVVGGGFIDESGVCSGETDCGMAKSHPFDRKLLQSQYPFKERLGMLVTRRPSRG